MAYVHLGLSGTTKNFGFLMGQNDRADEYIQKMVALFCHLHVKAIFFMAIWPIFGITLFIWTKLD